MENAPLAVSRILGGPATRPAPPIWTSLVGVKMSLVSSAISEMSLRLPTTVADGEFNAETQRIAKDAKDGRDLKDVNCISVQYSVFSIQTGFPARGGGGAGGVGGGGGGRGG